MRKLITIILILVCSKSFAQVYQLMPQYGYQAARMSFDSTLQIPTVCGVPNIKSVQFVNKKAAIAYDSCNAVFYTYSPKTLTWSAVGGGGGSTDTTSLSNRINLRIDSLRRSNDSIFARKNGVFVFQYKDSIGSGFVPYTGAIQDVDLGANKISAQSVYVTGTNGNGHLHLKHQNGDATATGQSTVLYANNNGDLKYKNDGNFFTTLKTSTNAADAIYTFPSATTTLLGASDTASLSSRINLKLNSSDTGSLSNRINLKLSASDTSSLSSRINLKLSITDTSSLQQKSLPANSIMGNNTNAAANPTSIFFKDTSGTYTGSPAWTGVAPTSGNFTYRFTRIGKLVTVNIALVYSVAGTTLTGVAIPLPSDAPTPSVPSGLTSALNMLYPAIFVAQQTATGLPLGNAPRAFLRNNAANNGFEIMCSFASSTILHSSATVQYTTP